ncbi:MAG: shikimate kinase [Paludibacter sp.]|jgi:shikimate kinase|nr:shikimate kinase [Paludibacter sp.]
MKRIFLIGYMGSGKTTIGKLLAARLGFSFVDMDKHIEEKEFKSVSQIFAEKGESEFRLIEQKCLYEVAEFENIVISTGGGAPCFFDNIRFMNTHGTTVYLKLSAAELADRLESSRANKRPLLAERKGEELQQFIAEGLAKREPFYEQAAYSVSGDIDEIVDQICKLI